MDGLPEDFDLEFLLAPFSGAPAGPDLRQDHTPQSPYFRLRDARAEARAEEREADKNIDLAIGDPGVSPHWQMVRRLALETIATRSKDLEVAAWLTEAALRIDQLHGFAAAVSLMVGLVERFWEAVHPLPDEEGMETRVAAVAGLNGSGGHGTLMQPLRKLVLFKRRNGDLVRYWEYEQSAKAEGRPEAERPKGVPAFADLEEDARGSDPAERAALLHDAEGALEAWIMLGARLDAAAGIDSPATGDVRELLLRIHKFAERHAPPLEAVADSEPPGLASAAPEAPIPGRQAPTSAHPGQAASRDDMLRELARIAEYFRRTEPHSPLAYTLEEAIRRGRMTWPELLQELMPELSARNEVLTRLGIKPAADAE